MKKLILSLVAVIFSMNISASTDLGKVNNKYKKSVFLKTKKETSSIKKNKKTVNYAVIHCRYKKNSDGSLTLIFCREI
mgnify:CR=1 FL=1